MGLIGCGHIGRRLIDFLRPFRADIWVYDPYLPAEIVDILGVLQTSLDQLLEQCDVIVCLAPLTPGTQGMMGKRELELIKPGATLVNVSRGAIFDSAALINDCGGAASTPVWMCLIQSRSLMTAKSCKCRMSL